MDNKTERDTPALYTHIILQRNTSPLLWPALRDTAKCMTGAKRDPEPHRKTYKTEESFVLIQRSFWREGQEVKDAG
jgi:hypothetical protein